MNGQVDAAVGRSILVVDDEESIRFTFRNFLEDEGYLASTAVGYDDAMELLQERTFDLIFIDIILGGKSGMDLLKDVKEIAPDTEIIIITGAPTVETASSALRLGALDYIVKPVRQETLLRITELALNHKNLRETKEAYRLNLEAIFRSVRDAIITVDENLIVAEVNSAAEGLCDIRRTVAVGRPLRSLSHFTTGKCLQALEQTVLQKQVIELSRIDCDSLEHPGQVVSVTATPLLRQDGTTSGGVIVIRNETRLIELERCLAESRQLGKIVGKSDAIRKVLSMIQALGDVQTSVLVTGDSGTGKELVADALHAAGSRRDSNLVKINCAALSEELLESELFGHVRGAFTGAIKDKVGRFQRADGGTIFLDEIGEMSPRMQTRFLRVLETMEFERVGDSTPIKVDVRVVAATNRDLEEKTKAGEFREDLYFRLKVVEINIPPLRERRHDIPLLVRHFLHIFNSKFSKRIEGVDDSVMAMFMNHPWPGNVRQLENILEHAFVLGRNKIIGPKELPEDFLSGAAAPSTAEAGDGSAEARAIRQALQLARYNKSEAARLLGISRRTLYRKLEQHKISTE